MHPITLIIELANFIAQTDITTTLDKNSWTLYIIQLPSLPLPPFNVVLLWTQQANGKTMLSNYNTDLREQGVSSVPALWPRL